MLPDEKSKARADVVSNADSPQNASKPARKPDSKLIQLQRAKRQHSRAAKRIADKIATIEERSKKTLAALDERRKEHHRAALVATHQLKELYEERSGRKSRS